MSESPQLLCLFGCAIPVPPELAPERLCVSHFTLAIEHTCAELRREITAGKLTAERQEDIARCLDGYAATLASVSTGTQRLSDELKKRILSTFLTLMLMRENLNRRVESELAKYSTTGRVRRTG
jgi:hypothetical protein